MPRDPQHPLAAHVQAAIDVGRGVGIQPKVAGQEGGRPLAPHVQAAIAAGQGLSAQPTIVGQESERPLAAHVQAAISVGRGGGMQLNSGSQPGGVAAQASSSTSRYLAGGGTKKIVDVYGWVQISRPRKYSKHESVKRALRWISTVVLAHYPAGIEVQSYLDKSGQLWISSNTDTVNDQLRKSSKAGVLYKHAKSTSPPELDWETDRFKRHKKHVYTRDVKDPVANAVLDAFKNKDFIVPSYKFLVREVYWDFKWKKLKLGKAKYFWNSLKVHAERRIHFELPEAFNERMLGGVKRPCAVCALALRITKSTRGFLFPDVGTKMEFGSHVAEGSGKRFPSIVNPLWKLKVRDKILVAYNGASWALFRYKRYGDETVRDYDLSKYYGFSYETKDWKGPTSYDTDSD